ncbi:hypothetical protein D9758_011005 [Tetrapyrgos nigripes]|uniref:Protein-serine/threonine kinase n=1 Tax=Tetrapyrgos nigripes TaxID=182062 RepID=A0A8H5GHI9_9AGAR|nr:hypothetical protein D9758_011005 [Tetrapyrgos nigripes]
MRELIKFPPVPPLPPDIRKALIGSRSSSHSEDPYSLPESTPNPSLEYMQLTNDYANNNFPLLDGSGGAFNGNPSSSYQQQHQQSNGNGNGNNPFTKLKLRLPLERRYYSPSSSLSLMNISYPPQIHQYNNDFTGVLERIKSRHDPTVTTVAQGVLEWKKTQRQKRIGLDIQQFLDRFYLSRIGIRFLIGQHIALNTQESHEDYVGIICTKANVHDIVQEAIENARFVCEDHYALTRSPPVQLICPRSLSFAYVPGHLSHIVFELLKNSLRAVVERVWREYNASSPKSPLMIPHDVEDKFPPIKVIVVEGKEDITIKISDEGGGIPRSAMGLIWTYMYTTMESGGLADLENEEGTEFHGSDFKAPMAGFGYGLPLSRLYARYFGGDLRLISMDGFGTDVYIHLNRLSAAREPLP